jgi:dTDP-glucose pyrophosphorylase/CBS domain-containing protein
MNGGILHPLRTPVRHRPGKVVGDFCVRPDATIEAAMVTIDRDGEGIALVTTDEGILLGTLTDGDIRRGLLHGVDMKDSVAELLAAKAKTTLSMPVTIRSGATDEELLVLMNERGVRHIPILNDGGQVVDLALMRTLVRDQVLTVTGVVMAGGAGQRMRPLTLDTPKPMLRVGEKPLMERIVEQMRDAGIGRICVTTHYKPEPITEHFGDGSRFGVTIDYINEHQPLGTAGALRALEASDTPLLVMNGDIFAEIDFRVMLEYHRDSKADITVGVRKYETVLPFGVIECTGSQVVSIVEKPRREVLINAGIYLVEPSILPMIPSGQRYDMTDLIRAALAADRHVEAFPIREFWLDVGRPEDYKRAQAEADKRYR